MTGLDLKLKRVAADVKAIDIANAMGVGSSRISVIERGRGDVTPETEARYLDALRTCVTKSTSTSAA